MPDAVSHICSAIDRTLSEANPAPYIFVEKIFPDPVYASLTSLQYRSEAVLTEQIHKGDPKIFFGSYRDRLEARIPSDTDQLNSTDAVAWRDLASDLSSIAVLSSIAAKFSAGIRARFGSISASELHAQLRPSVLYTKHRPGYYLGPHTDRSEKVVTCVFNFAERDGLDHLGTTIYEPNAKGFTCDGTVHHDPKLFRPIGIAPYRPNSAFIFLRDDRLFHGVERLTVDGMMGSQRPNVQFNLWTT